MSFEHVTVIAAGAVYDDWETVIIENDVHAGYVNVLLTTTEITPIGASTQSAFDKWNFPPGTPIDIYAGNDLVVSAVVWQYAPSADATQHSITVYARTASYRYVNSSVDPRPSGGNFENKTVIQLIQTWAQAVGINALSFGDNTELVPIWQLRQGANGFEEGLRMLKPRGKMLFGLMDGSIAVSDGQAMGVQGPIVQGENILRMSAQLTDDFYQERIVTGQRALGVDFENHIQPEAMTTSDLAHRRLKLITEPAAIDKELAINRADWETRREHGATVQAIITVPGWHAPSGESYVPRNVPPGSNPSGTGPLWMLMADTYIFAPWLKIDCVMRCNKVVFKQSLSEGTVTELTFTDPAAYTTNSSPCNNGTMWLPKFDLGSVFHPPGIGHN